MPLISQNIYTSVRSALDGCADDMMGSCFGITDKTDPELPYAFHELLNTSNEIVKGDKTEQQIIFKKHPNVPMYQNLMHYWTHDPKAQQLIKNSHNIHDITDKLSVQICVLESILDDIAEVELNAQDLNVNSLHHLQGEQRLDELLKMAFSEENPLKKQKLHLEIIRQQVDLKHIQPNDINTQIDLVSRQAQQEIQARREEKVRQIQKERQETKSGSAEPDNARFQDFKDTYKKTYKAAFFKNPWSTMKGKLERNEFTTLAEIRAYAQQHPKTRSAKILTQLEAAWTQQDQQQERSAVVTF